MQNEDIFSVKQEMPLGDFLSQAVEKGYHIAHVAMVPCREIADILEGIAIKDISKHSTRIGVDLGSGKDTSGKLEYIQKQKDSIVFSNPDYQYFRRECPEVRLPATAPERREWIAKAIRDNVSIPDLLEVWEECEPMFGEMRYFDILRIHFVEKVPYLKALLAGLIQFATACFAHEALAEIEADLNKQGQGRAVTEFFQGIEAGKMGSKQADPETEFFEGPEAMEKAFAAAHRAGLTDKAGKWSYPPRHKIKAITLFWLAARNAHLAKIEAPVRKVVLFLKDRFGLQSLGKNAIDKTARVSDFDQERQRLYNKLLTYMVR